MAILMRPSLSAPPRLIIASTTVDGPGVHPLVKCNCIYLFSITEQQAMEDFVQKAPQQ